MCSLGLCVHFTLGTLLETLLKQVVFEITIQQLTSQNHIENKTTTPTQAPDGNVVRQLRKTCHLDIEKVEKRLRQLKILL